MVNDKGIRKCRKPGKECNRTVTKEQKKMTDQNEYLKDLGLIVVLLRRPMLHLFFGSIEADVMENALIYLTISAFSFL